MRIRAIMILLLFAIFGCESVNLHPAKDGDKWGYINDKGKFVIKAQFDYAEEFKGDVALVQWNIKKERPMTDEEMIENRSTIDRFVDSIGREANPDHQPIRRVGTVTIHITRHAYIDKKGKILRSWDDTYER
jgi:hypothetical protein